MIQSYVEMARAWLVQARKYKAMGLPDQRRSATEWALYWRSVSRI